MLKESGWREEDGSETSELEDLSTRAEQQLGRLVKEKYNTDYYILGKLQSSSKNKSQYLGCRQIPSRCAIILHHAQ